VHCLHEHGICGAAASFVSDRRPARSVGNRRINATSVDVQGLLKIKISLIVVVQRLREARTTNWTGRL
jgi:hypothetical protein